MQSVTGGAGPGQGQGRGRGTGRGGGRGAADSKLGRLEAAGGSQQTTALHPACGPTLHLQLPTACTVTCLSLQEKAHQHIYFPTLRSNQAGHELMLIARDWLDSAGWREAAFLVAGCSLVARINDDEPFHQDRLTGRNSFQRVR